MSYEKLIHEYLDSGLDESAEQVLFAEVSSNSEVRTEFNHQIRLNNIAAKDMQTIVPPSDITKNVFTSLGFSPPIQPIASIVTSSFINWKKYSSYIFTALLGATISYLIFFGDTSIPHIAFNQNTSNTNNTIQKTHFKQNSNKAIASSFSDGFYVSNANNYIINNKNNAYDISLPILDNSTKSNKLESIPSNQSKNYNSNSNFASSFNSSFIDNKNENSKSFFTELVDGLTSLLSDGLIIEPFTNNENDYNKSKSESENLKDINLGNGLIPTKILGNNNSTFQNNIINEIETNWTVQFRMNTNKSFPDVNISNNTELFDNMSISILYDIKNDFFVGAEFGKERYGLEYQRTIAGSKQIEAKNPSLIWYGANLKWMPSKLFANSFFNPYAQLGLGATTIGPMARGQAGVYIRPDVRFSLLFGYEFSKLWYKAGQNSFYNSNNQGYSIGINYNF